MTGLLSIGVLKWEKSCLNCKPVRIPRSDCLNSNKTCLEINNNNNNNNNNNSISKFNTSFKT